MSILTVLLLLIVGPGPAGAAVKSKWTTHYDLANTPVHMVLSPSADDTSHSRLVWWRGFEPGGGDWGGYVDWRPLTVDTTNAFWPTPSFGFHSHSGPPNTFDVFCAGHTHVSAGGGRILVSGGTSKTDFEVGMTHSLLLDPATMTWDTSSVANMSGRRWYPTNTQLGSDKVVVSSGSKYFHGATFGGIRGSETNPSDRWVRLARLTTFGGFEDSTLTPTPPTSTTNWPSAREGHASVWTGSGAIAHFGGRTGTNTFSREVWYEFPNEAITGDHYPYTWNERTPAIDKPSARTESSFGIIRQDCFVAWGGRDASGVVGTTPYLWRYKSTGGYEWITLSPTGTAPSARTAHMWAGSSEDSSIYILGGATNTTGTVTTDADVYKLTVTNPTGLTPTAAWSTIATSGTAPALTAGGMMFMDDRAHKQPGDTGSDSLAKRLIVFGGHDSSNAHPNKVYVLRLKASGAVWSSITPTTGLGRERFGAVYDEATQRLYLTGGESSGVKRADVRWLDVSNPTAAGSRDWKTLDSLSAATSGHTVVQNRTVTYARRPEFYSPTGTQWTTLAPRSQDWYPFGFTIPDALAPGSGTRVFYAGPADTSYWLDPSNSSGSWSAGPSYPKFRGGSAVMYRIGKIMKSGTRDTEVGATARRTTSQIDLSAGTPAWTTNSDSMSVGRVNHNLVLLPTGDVFCTGGTGKARNDADIDPRLRPEIWDAATSTWSGGEGSTDTLEADHHHRGYHSNSMLMPDGRLLCGGGNATNDPNHHHDRNTLNIFTPPYLFNASGALATRPVLQQWDKKTDLGQWTPFQTDSAVDEVVLLRPGAATHGFNQEQRYLKLDVATSGVKWARIPADADSLPPGDYLIFALKNKVPAIAQWIKLSNLADPPPEPVTTLGIECPLTTNFRVVWNAPCEDGNDATSGRCHDYQLYKRDGSPVDTTNLATSTLVATGHPGIPGSEEAMVIGVTTGHRYYFRMRSKDAGSPNGQYSSWSPAVSAIATMDVDCSEGLEGGGEGGGGYRAQNVTARIGSGGSGGADRQGNSLLDGAPHGESHTDILPLPSPPGLAGGLRRVWLRQGGNMIASHLRGVNLVAVDHPEGAEVVVSGSRYLMGERRPIGSVLERTAEGGRFTCLQDERVTLSSGDVLEVNLAGSADGEVAPLLLVAHSSGDAASSDSTGFLVMSAAEGGGWAAIGRYAARRNDAPIVIGGLSGSRVRIVAIGSQTFTSIGQFLPTGSPEQVTRLDAASAMHSVGGDALSGLGGQGGLALQPGESLTADFAEPALDSLSVRTWFLEVDGSREAATSTAGSARSGRTPEPEPLQFAVQQNRPNPFRGSTSIAFTLPSAMRARLEVFDLLGRRVRLVTDARLDAGEHRIEWDGRDDERAAVRPGIYMYRVTTDDHRQERKLVLLRH